MGCERNNKFRFLYLTVGQRKNGTIQKSIHETEMCQLCQLLSSQLQTHLNRDRMLYSNDKIKKKLALKKKLDKDIFSKMFIVKVGKYYPKDENNQLLAKNLYSSFSISSEIKYEKESIK